MRGLRLALVAAAIGSGVPGAAFAQTLDLVRERGFVQCGVTGGVPGFSISDEANGWAGLEVDYCRALAAAIFDDPEAVRYTVVPARGRFEVLGNGTVDVLSRTTSWTMGRDANLSVSFVGTMFYDGQGFLVREDEGIGSVLELSGVGICMQSETTTEVNAADYFTANGMDPTSFISFPSRDEAVQAYLDGRCEVYTADASTIAAERTRFTDPSAHVILPEIISKEPLGPVVRSDDIGWFNIARWVLFALINAEELGINSDNVENMLGSDDPEIRRLLGVEADFGAALGLGADWAYRVIAHVGNYGELYERHVGEGTPIAIPRGINNLWTQGGIMYAPPIR